MKAKKFREQTPEEVATGLETARKELLALRVQETAKNMGRAPVKARGLRRDIARMKTILREREIEKK